MSTNLQRNELLKDLHEEVESSFASGKLNNLADLGLSFVAIVTSLTATVLATTGIKPEWVVAAVAALPAACASLQRIVDFRSRSNWYFQYTSRVRALANALKFAESPDVADFARQWGVLDVQMASDWAQIGKKGSKGPIRKQRSSEKSAEADKKTEKA